MSDTNCPNATIFILKKNDNGCIHATNAAFSITGSKYSALKLSFGESCIRVNEIEIYKIKV